MILETNPDLFPMNKFVSKRMLRIKFEQMKESFFRKEFDKSNLDYDAKAVIEVAKEYGLDISEMEVDYALELSRKEVA